MATPSADSSLAEANNDNNEVASISPPPTLASPTSPEDMKAIPNGTASSASMAESTTTVASTETAAVSTTTTATTTTTTEEEEPVSTTTTGTSDAGGDVESSRASSATAASVFSEEQKAELRASFDECDKEKTGFISVGDLKSVVGTLGLNLDEDLIREMIDKFDLKRSGEIDFEEFVEMMASTTQGGPPLNAEEEIRQIFTVTILLSIYLYFGIKPLFGTTAL